MRGRACHAAQATKGSAGYPLKRELSPVSSLVSQPAQTLRLRCGFASTNCSFRRWLPLAAVALCGLTLGFFAWYARDRTAPRRVSSRSSGCSSRSPALPRRPLAVWLGYARYFSRRAGIDAGAFAALRRAGRGCRCLLLWLTFVLPPQITHGARLFLVAASLLLRRQGAHRRAFQPDRARRAARLRRHARRRSSSSRNSPR